MHFRFFTPYLYVHGQTIVFGGIIPFALYFRSYNPIYLSRSIHRFSGLHLFITHLLVIYNTKNKNHDFFLQHTYMLVDELIMTKVLKIGPI